MSVSNEPFILIVDDNPTNLSVLSKALKSVGYKIRMAVDGEEALSQVNRAHPELILLDIQMPKLDGFATCRHLQNNPETAGIPIIFMTALVDTKVKVEGLSLGAVDYITKPFFEPEVLARVKIHWRFKQLTDTLEKQVAEHTQKLEQAQIQLVQQEKLSTLGQLVAGVAHEINNPVGFLKGNIQPAQDYVQDLFDLIDLYQQKLPVADEEIVEKIEEIDWHFLREDLPKLLKSMNLGVERINTISNSLRTFSRADRQHKNPFNLHQGLDSTLLILKHRLKANENRPEIEVIKDYGNLPDVECFPGQLNQVFMNLLANAIDALDEASLLLDCENTEANKYRITVSTSLENSQAKISITDNGQGISEEVQSKIFDHLFTTKDVGKGTGLGLAITRQIIVDKHGGSVDFKSQVDQGTTFIVQIPLTAECAQTDAQKNHHPLAAILP